MALGLLILNDGSLRPVAADKALHYYQVLHGEVEPTEEDAEKVIHIRDIKLPPSVRPAGYKPLDSPYEGDRTKHMDVFRPLDDPKAPGPDSHLTNRGIEQGMAQGLPVNDR